MLRTSPPHQPKWSGYIPCKPHVRLQPHFTQFRADTVACALSSPNHTGRRASMRRPAVGNVQVALEFAVLAAAVQSTPGAHSIGWREEMGALILTEGAPVCESGRLRPGRCASMRRCLSHTPPRLYYDAMIRVASRVVCAVEFVSRDSCGLGVLFVRPSASACVCWGRHSRRHTSSVRTPAWGVRPSGRR